MTLLLPADQNVLKGIDRCIDAGRNVEAKYTQQGKADKALVIEQFTARLEALRAEFIKVRNFDKRLTGGPNFEKAYDKDTEHA